MAETTKPARKRVGDYNPDVETGEVLDEIANTTVVISSVAFDERSGRNGKYTLSIITLDNGKLYHTGSPVVAERLSAVPMNEFPVEATFVKVKSQNDPSRSYWSVN